MRINIIKRLFLLNFLYSNKVYTDHMRKQFKNNDNIPLKIFYGHIKWKFVLIALFSVYIYFIDFNAFPGSYKYVVLWITILTTFAIANLSLTLIYENKVTFNLLTLPISKKELFYSKIATLFFLISDAIVTILILNFFLYIQSDYVTLEKFIITLIFSITQALVILFAIILITTSITLLPNFAKHFDKMKFINSIGGFLFGGVLGGLPVVIKMEKNSFTEGDMFVNILLKNSNQTTYIILLIMLASSVILITLVNKLIVGNYEKTLYKLNKVTNKKKDITNAKNTTLRKKLIQRNLKLFATPSLFFYQFSNLLTISPMFIIPLVKKEPIPEAPITVLPVFILVAAMVTKLLNQGMSYSAIAISLEKRDYLMLKSLPLDLKKYLKLKLILATISQLIIFLPILIILLLIFKANIIFTIASLSSFIIGIITTSMYNFIYDFEHLHLTWNTKEELLQRSKNPYSSIIVNFSSFIFAIVLILLTLFSVEKFYNTYKFFTALYSVAIIIIFIYYYVQLKRRVWDKL